MLAERRPQLQQLAYPDLALHNAMTVVASLKHVRPRSHCAALSHYEALATLQVLMAQLGGQTWFTRQVCGGFGFVDSCGHDGLASLFRNRKRFSPTKLRRSPSEPVL